jgi:hypothetical protein
MLLSAKTLLYLTAHTCQLAHWKGRQLEHKQTFTADAAGQQQFADYLRQPQPPIHLLLDLVEEDFRHETIPHVRGANHRALIARKFEHHFPNTPFRQFQHLRRRRDGRCDDEILLSALTNPQRITPWLEILHRMRTPLVGVYSAANVSAALLSPTQKEHTLLISWQKHAGLRQSYFQQGHLRFSRLTPFSTERALAKVVADETPRALQYLKSLNLSSSPLNIFILCHPDERAALQAQLTDTADCRYIFLNNHIVTKSSSGEELSTDSDASELYLHTLATKPPAKHDAPKRYHRDYLLWQSRYIAYGLALIVLLVSVGLSAISAWETQTLINDRLLIQTQISQLTKHTEALRAQFPATVIPADDMKMAVKINERLKQYFPAAPQILQKLSLALSPFERVQLNKLNWQLDQIAANAENPVLLLVLEGELLGFGDDNRAALSYLNELQDQLRQHGYQVSAEKTPLDISANGHIQSEQLAQPNANQAFVLKLSWRAPA